MWTECANLLFELEEFVLKNPLEEDISVVRRALMEGESRSHVDFLDLVFHALPLLMHVLLGRLSE